MRVILLVAQQYMKFHAHFNTILANPLPLLIFLMF